MIDPWLIPAIAAAACLLAGVGLARAARRWRRRETLRQRLGLDARPFGSWHRELRS